ncbi:hypothetical protein SFUMM280S_09916 [Streptomyces fumanus]
MASSSVNSSAAPPAVRLSATPLTVKSCGTPRTDADSFAPGRRSSFRAVPRSTTTSPEAAGSAPSTSLYGASRALDQPWPNASAGRPASEVIGTDTSGTAAVTPGTPATVATRSSSSRTRSVIGSVAVPTAWPG